MELFIQPLRVTFECNVFKFQKQEKERIYIPLVLLFTPTKKKLYGFHYMSMNGSRYSNL